MTGCKQTSRDRATDRPVAVVTFPQQAALLRPLLGDEYEILTLLPPGSDPESYEPSMSTMKALSRAEIYFSMGAPGFEEAVLRGIKENFPKLTVIDASKGIERIEDNHDHHHGHHGHHSHHSGLAHSHDYEDEDPGYCTAGDPHLLTSVRNGQRIALNMAEGLIKLHPEKEADYKLKYNRLDSTLRVADDSLRSILNGRAGAFVVKHPSLSYFARDYGLRQIALEQEGKEPSPKGYFETLKKIKKENPAIVISELQHSSRNLEEAAKRMKIPVVEVDLYTEDWIRTLFIISHTISQSEFKGNNRQRGL